MPAPPSTPTPEYPPSTAIGSDERVRLRRDVAWNLVPVALLGIVGLGLNFAIVGWWDAEALALFNLVTIAMFVHAVIGAWGIQYSVLRAVATVAHDRDRVASVVVGALVPNVVLSLAVTIVFVALRGPIATLLDSEGVGVGIAWAAPGLACFAINKVLFGVVNGLRRMRAFAMYTSLRYVLIAVGLVVARVLRVPAEHLPGIWSFAEGILFCVLVIELLATVAVRRTNSTWRTWSHTHLAYGARGVTATLAYEINTKLDVWMLGAFHVDKSLVGVYSLVAALNEGVMQLGVVVQNNLNPLVASAYSVGEVVQIDALVTRTRRWFVPAFVAICAIGLSCYPLIIPALVHDPRFTAGTLPFVVLMAGLALASPWLPFNQLLLMCGRPGWHTAFIVTVVTINFVVDLALIPVLGLTGAAIATSLAVVSSAVIVRAMGRRLTGVRL